MKKMNLKRWLAAVVFTALLCIGAGVVSASAASNEMEVIVKSGYLALRSAKAYDSSNEIGKLYTGDRVTAADTSDKYYWYVYSSKLGKYGYVNKDYICYCSTEGAPVMTVKVNDGYLALRNEKAFDSSNEIGKLYTGESVTVTDKRDSQYWFVYSSKLNKYGYVNKDYLYGSTPSPSGTTMTVKVNDGYLALRTAKAFDASNEIGKLYTGESVVVQDTSDGQYWYVYAPTLGKYGYVNKDYLVGSSPAPKTGGTTMTVKVNDGYLALRTAKAFDASNEIGKLYTGDTVQVQDTSDGQYWYVYAPSLGKNGYVNKDYLVGSSTSTSGTPMTVKVNDGYLALRTAKAFDASNEIGKLYTGETVLVQDTSDGQYWYVYAPSLGKSGYVNKDYLR